MYGYARRLIPAFVAAVLLAMLLDVVLATEEQAPCPAVQADELLEGRLPDFSRKWREGASVRIVALGSSSTAGQGASTPLHSYPSQLAQMLRSLWPGHEVVVVNVGVNGQEAVDMLARLERDVLAQQPDLVLWQLGSNGVIRGLPVEGMESAARTGIARIRAAGADVVLIDLQHAPRIDEGATRDQVLEMMRLLARDTGVALFHRYRLMRAWDQQLGAAYRGMVHEDRLHMTDLSYRCMARELALSLDHNLAHLDPLRR